MSSGPNFYSLAVAQDNQSLPASPPPRLALLRGVDLVNTNNLLRLLWTVHPERIAIYDSYDEAEHRLHANRPLKTLPQLDLA